MFVVFFGSFYLINLVLAVVAVSYQQEVVAMQQRVSVAMKGYIFLAIICRHDIATVPLGRIQIEIAYQEFLLCASFRKLKGVDHAMCDSHFKSSRTVQCDDLP